MMIIIITRVVEKNTHISRYIYSHIYIPIKADSNQCKNRRSHCNIADEIIHCTVDTTEGPIRVQHIDEIEYAIQ